MPANVKDAARGSDDGKTASGAGTVSITISQDGEISGKGQGALGDVTIRGKTEDGVIRASIFPDSPSAPSAMTGTLIGTVKERSIAVELRASGPDATIVRESTFELTRK